ncbi:MAG: type IV pilus twitching motility protein PilT [Endomicrobiales bacterium]
MNFNELLTVLVKKGISDVHFKAGSAPLVRVHGRLVSTGLDRFTAPHVEELASSLMNAEQKKQFEAENELDFAYSVDGVSRFRVNMYRQRGTLALTLRVVPFLVKTIEELNLPAEPLKKLAAEPRGLILITGITGAGKTTTLNSMLDYINENFPYKIVTVEDPIEYYHADKKSSLSQREVGEDTRSYAVALKHVLRQDPDVVVIGEMRDFEAMQAGITAAETGHLVLSTIHTMDAVQTIGRIVDSYPPHLQNTIRSQLANVIKGIVAQRLVLAKDGEGRLPATEILIGTSLVRKLIAEGKIAEVYKAMEQGSYYGMHTFDSDLMQFYLKGRISLEEALDKASNPDDLSLRLKGIERGE